MIVEREPLRASSFAPACEVADRSMPSMPEGGPGRGGPPALARRGAAERPGDGAAGRAAHGAAPHRAGPGLSDVGSRARDSTGLGSDLGTRIADKASDLCTPSSKGGLG